MVASSSKEGDACGSVRFISFEVEINADRAYTDKTREVDIEMMWLGSI